MSALSNSINFLVSAIAGSGSNLAATALRQTPVNPSGELRVGDFTNANGKTAGQFSVVISSEHVSSQLSQIMYAAANPAVAKV